MYDPRWTRDEIAAGLLCLLTVITCSVVLIHVAAQR